MFNPQTGINMKKVVFSFIISLLVISNIIAQNQLPVDPETKKITYTEVVQVDGALKDDLYLKAKNWALSNGFKQVSDSKADGKFVAKGQFGVQYPSPMKGMNHSGTVTYLFTISVKDGKYKYELVDFVHESPKGNGGKLENDIPQCGKYTLVPSGWSTIKSKSAESAQATINSLKQELANAPAAVEKKSEDW